jgi:hypothetical protein
MSLNSANILENPILTNPPLSGEPAKVEEENIETETPQDTATSKKEYELLKSVKKYYKVEVMGNKRRYVCLADQCKKTYSASNSPSYLKNHIMKHWNLENLPKGRELSIEETLNCMAALRISPNTLTNRNFQTLIQNHCLASITPYILKKHMFSYVKSKEKQIKGQMKSSCVCLITDAWSVFKRHVLVIFGVFLNNNFQPKKTILSVKVQNAHFKGETIGSALLDTIKKYNLEGNFGFFFSKKINDPRK